MVSLPTISRGMTTHRDAAEYRDSPGLKVLRGFVSMKFDDPSKAPVKPVMTHFFRMNSRQPERVSYWSGSVGPVEF